LRNKADYLPLKVGNEWHYAYGSDSLIVAVDDDTIIGDLSCYIVIFENEYQYWHYDEDGVRRHFTFSVGPTGTEYNLESRYYPLFPYPLIDGSSFQDSFRFSDVIEGDTVYYFHSLTGDIISEEGDRYRVRLKELILVQSTWLDSTMSWISTFVLKPDVGIETYIDAKGRTWSLRSYSIR